MSDVKIEINRAPVLTLWAVVVAQRLGHSRAEALTLGKALAGLNAQAKGRRLGIYAPQEAGGAADEGPLPEPEATVELMGRSIPVVKAGRAKVAAIRGQAIDPKGVERYLQSKFGDGLSAAQQALEDLAGSYKPAELAEHAFSLYEKFRPEIPRGKKGWGIKGILDLSKIQKLKAN